MVRWREARRRPALPKLRKRWLATGPAPAPHPRSGARLTAEDRRHIWIGTPVPSGTGPWPDVVDGTPAKNYSLRRPALYFTQEAITDVISSLRSWPISWSDESLRCRVASGSSSARRRAMAIGAL